MRNSDILFSQGGHFYDFSQILPHFFSKYEHYATYTAWTWYISESCCGVNVLDIIYDVYDLFMTK
jgi:hypothetical protein